MSLCGAKIRLNCTLLLCKFSWKLLCYGKINTNIHRFLWSPVWPYGFSLFNSAGVGPISSCSKPTIAHFTVKQTEAQGQETLPGAGLHHERISRPVLERSFLFSNSLKWQQLWFSAVLSQRNSLPSLPTFPLDTLPDFSFAVLKKIDSFNESYSSPERVSLDVNPCLWLREDQKEPVLLVNMPAYWSSPDNPPDTVATSIIFSITL